MTATFLAGAAMIASGVLGIIGIGGSAMLMVAGSSAVLALIALAAGPSD